MRIRFNILFVLIAVVIIINPKNSYAQKFSKNEIKAAFVFNFIQFVTWPEEKKILTLGIVGNNEFTSVLETKLNNQKIGNRLLKVVHYSCSQKQFNCDVIFIANDKKTVEDTILNEIKNKSILSIGEIDGFCLKGGIINFIEGDNSNYFFEINQTRAIEEKIIISSKLLKLAIHIK